MALLLPKRVRGHLRERAGRLAYGVMASMLSLLIALSAGELAYRLYHRPRYGVPYWVSGRVEYIPTWPYGRHVRRFALLHSGLLFLVVRKLDTLLVRHRLADEFVRDRAFPHAVQVTSELMGRVRRRAGNVPIVAFNCDDDPPYVEALKAISGQHGVVFLEDVARSVTRAERGGAVVRTPDEKHWSAAGHRIVGHAVAEYLRRHVLSPTHSTGTEPAGGRS